MSTLQTIQFQSEYKRLTYWKNKSLLSGSIPQPTFFVKRGGKFPLGGDEGTRTPDLLRAREALSHLSYIPKINDQSSKSQ